MKTINYILAGILGGILGAMLIYKTSGDIYFLYTILIGLILLSLISVVFDRE
jgi:hypothetical protein